jgi:cytochrome P450
MENITNPALLIDPLSHTRVRGLMEKAYTQSNINAIRKRLQKLADDLLDKVQTRGHMDIVHDLAAPLSFTTIMTELLGIPVKATEQFSQWAFDFGRILGNAPTTPEDDQQILKSLWEMNNFFGAIIEQRRQEPKPDFITALIMAKDQGNQLSQQELISNISLMFTAALTPSNFAISNGILALLRNPEQMQKLQDYPSLIESAVDEFLRYESPIQWCMRRATEDIKLHGQLIHKDQVVLVGIGAANYDPAQFSNPDQLDITRADNRHLAFGHGPHLCIGWILARIQAQIAINTVLRRMQGLSLKIDSLVWVGAPALRGPASLSVTFS